MLFTIRYSWFGLAESTVRVFADSLGQAIEVVKACHGQSVTILWATTDSNSNSDAGLEDWIEGEMSQAQGEIVAKYGEML